MEKNLTKYLQERLSPFPSHSNVKSEKLLNLVFNLSVFLLWMQEESIWILFPCVFTQETEISKKRNECNVLKEGVKKKSQSCQTLVRACEMKSLHFPVTLTDRSVIFRALQGAVPCRGVDKVLEYWGDMSVLLCCCLRTGEINSQSVLWSRIACGLKAKGL